MSSAMPDISLTGKNIMHLLSTFSLNPGFFLTQQSLLQFKKKLLNTHPSFPIYSDKPYSMFKPGQQSLERDYYSKATQEVADGKKNL